MANTEQAPEREHTAPDAVTEQPSGRRMSVTERMRVAGPITAVAAALLVGLALDLGGWDLAASLVWGAAIVAAAVPLLIETVKAFARREAGVDALALLAMGGALALGELLAGAVIAVMWVGGEALESYAASRARRELTALVEGAPRDAHRLEGERIVDIDVDEVVPGDRLIVRPGEVVPVDGLVDDGTAVLDESTLTGESRPVERGVGERLASGAINTGAPVRLRATATAADSTYAGLVRLVEAAQADKPPFERLADRAAGWFTPLAILLAALAWAVSGDPVRALAVIVVATPCPMILAAPIAITSGVSQLARSGVLVKGGGVLEALADVDTVLLDKTGTLTAGNPRLLDVIAFADADADPDEVVRLAASLDQMSAHVFAPSVVEAARTRGLAPSFPSEVTSEPGNGITGRVDGALVRVGRGQWVADGPLPPEARAVKRRTALEGTSPVFVGRDGRLLGALLMDDPLRPEAARTVRSLRDVGVARLAMVTGDGADIAELVGEAVGIDKVLAERTPDDKVEAVDALRADRSTSSRRDRWLAGRRHGRILMVGDGVNDAPALAHADIGAAMGARGATASSEAADVIVVVDRIDRLPEAIAASQRARRIAWQSVIGGIAASVVAMGVAAAGYLPPVAGAVVQEIIDLAAIANALRALRTGQRLGAPTHLAEQSASLRHEHRRLASGIDRLRMVADRLDAVEGPDALAELRELHAFLHDDLLPHELGEEHDVYPALSDVAGDEDPTAPLRHTHREIVRLVRLLGHTIDSLDPSGPDAADKAELRRLLYGLHAIIRMHNAQEEEAYGLLEAANAPGPGSRSAAGG